MTNLALADRLNTGIKQKRHWLHSPEDFVAFITQLLRGRYRRAKRVHLVVDHLNIHFAKVFVDVLGEKRAA